VRRAEEYATLGADVVVEMGSETFGRRPAARAWAIVRRAQRAERRAGERTGRSQRRQADRAARPGRSRRQSEARKMVADAR